MPSATITMSALMTPAAIAPLRDSLSAWDRMEEEEEAVATTSTALVQKANTDGAQGADGSLIQVVGEIQITGAGSTLLINDHQEPEDHDLMLRQSTPPAAVSDCEEEGEAVSSGDHGSVAALNDHDLPDEAPAPNPVILAPSTGEPRVVCRVVGMPPPDDQLPVIGRAVGAPGSADLLPIMSAIDQRPGISGVASGKPAADQMPVLSGVAVADHVPGISRAAAGDHVAGISRPQRHVHIRESIEIHEASDSSRQGILEIER